MTADELATAVGTEAANELASALARIKHCLGQLSDEQVWWRSRPSLNSVGNLVLHLCGNLRQWIVAGLGGAADVRGRPAEFAERGPIPRDELLRRLEAVVDESRAVLARQTARQLLEARRIHRRYRAESDLRQRSPLPGSHAGDHRHDPVAAWGCLQVRLDADDAGARWPDLRNRAA